MKKLMNLMSITVLLVAFVTGTLFANHPPIGKANYYKLTNTPKKAWYTNGNKHRCFILAKNWAAKGIKINELGLYTNHQPGNINDGECQ